MTTHTFRTRNPYSGLMQTHRVDTENSPARLPSEITEGAATKVGVAKKMMELMADGMSAEDAYAAIAH